MSKHSILDLILLQSSMFYNIEDLDERRRSNEDLVRFFFQLQAATKPELSIEIGAFQATFSREMKRMFPRIRCIAFEANPYNFHHFKSNEQIATSGIEYVHMAISNYTGTCEFYAEDRIDEQQIEKIRATSGLLTRRRADYHADYQYEAVAVPCTSLAEYLEREGLENTSFAAWVDVEGASERVLKGAESVLPRCSSLLIEVEQYPFWDKQWFYSDVLKYLVRQNFVPVARDFEFLNQFNVVFVKKTLLRDYRVRNILEMHLSAMGHRKA